MTWINANMDTKSKILFVFFLVLLIASIALTYYRTMVLRDYSVTQSEVKE